MRALNRERRLEDAASTLITVERAGAGLRLWHAGDQRGYRIAQGQALRITQDHTAVNVLRAEGSLSAEEAVALEAPGLANALDNNSSIPITRNRPPSACKPSNCHPGRRGCWSAMASPPS